MNLEKPLVAAAAQISPVFMNKKASVEKYAECIHEAGRQGVDLVVTPETGIPSYPYWRNNFGYTTPESAASASADNVESVQYVRTCAARSSISASRSLLSPCFLRGNLLPHFQDAHFTCSGRGAPYQGGCWGRGQQ